jgi:hypothetical protein
MTTRRETLKLIAGPAGFALVYPRLVTAGAAYEPRYFTTVEMRLLGVLSEVIIPTDEHSPGAISAGVPEYIDTIVGAGSEQLKQAWSRGLAAIDAIARASHGELFAACTPEQQIGVLQVLAANEDHPTTAGEEFFVTLKRATIDGYYTSAVGIHQDLEYQGNTMVHDFQGCAHPKHRGS